MSRPTDAFTLLRSESEGTVVSSIAETLRLAGIQLPGDGEIDQRQILHWLNAVLHILLGDLQLIEHVGDIRPHLLSEIGEFQVARAARPHPGRQIVDARSGSNSRAGCRSFENRSIAVVLFLYDWIGVHRSQLGSGYAATVWTAQMLVLRVGTRVTTRNVAVLDWRGVRLKTYPITIEGKADDAGFAEAALERARRDNLVPEQEQHRLTARVPPLNKLHLWR
jgi:hypothetical protein